MKNGNSVSQSANKIYRSLKIIFEVLDKGNKGLLLGDIHPKIIYGCGEVVENSLKLIEEENKNLSWSKIIEDMYN